MKQKIVSCLWFNDQAQEAARFYVTIFKNSKFGKIAHYDEASSKASGMPVGSVLTATFQILGQEFMGLNGGHIFNFSPAISLFVHCKKKQDVEELFNKLSQGGEVMMPLDKYPFSEKFAFFKDKYGVSWQVMHSDKNEHISPCLLFVGKDLGKAEEALNFYTKIFKNTKIDHILHYEKGEDGKTGTVKHSSFFLEGQEFVAMDGAGLHKFSFNESISFIVNCETQKEVDYYWEKLTADGGKESVCGWLKDKFGISWQVVPTVLDEMMSDKDTKKAERVMKAMLEMKKLDINILKKAYDNKEGENMAEKKIENGKNSKNTFTVISRIINAPRDVVFKVFTEPQHLKNWWGPKGFSCPFVKVDMRKGGKYVYCMRGEITPFAGKEFWSGGKIIEFDAPKKIVLTDYFSDEKGNKVEPASYGMDPNFPKESVVTVKFDEEKGKTRLSIIYTLPETDAGRKAIQKSGMEVGWNQSIDKLDLEVVSATATVKEFVISRAYDAPKEKVWEAFTIPEVMAKWWGPKGTSALASKMDFKIGGNYHYCLKYPDGSIMWGKQVYLDILPPKKLVFINSFSNEKGEITKHPMSETWPLEMLTTLTFVENKGKTTLTIRWLPMNASENECKTFDEGRDSMKQGWTGSLDQLEKYFATQTKQKKNKKNKD
jgi:predicted 3-demethylubiquinone-9 3-methyltransferase (glyoxalase superfamily)/uncharacterized protein YndB with AHSA1/START domain